jgi:hypothetical protein
VRVFINATFQTWSKGTATWQHEVCPYLGPGEFFLIVGPIFSHLAALNCKMGSRMNLSDVAFTPIIQPAKTHFEKMNARSITKNRTISLGF